MAKDKACAICGEIVGSALELRQARDRYRLCSFECLVALALDRFRQRRDYHNQEITELKRKLSAAKQARRLRRNRRT